MIDIPGHAGHEFAQRAGLGKYFHDVDLWIDAPVKVLGFNHRVARHSPIELFAKYQNDPDRLNAAFMHVITDFAGSADPNFRAMLDAAGLYVRSQARLEQIKEEISQLTLRGLSPTKKLQEQSQIQHEIELASMIIMVALL